jgi:hypothetical protein
MPDFVQTLFKVIPWITPVVIVMLVAKAFHVISSTVNKTYSSITIWMLCLSIVTLISVQTTFIHWVYNYNWLVNLLIIIIYTGPYAIDLLQQYEWE